ncbi:MAG: tRNA (adenosine(37)-N6)-threonylcarbamoyltransferase complex transferase subunit TsaD [Eubacteriales bacterium]|nr:tRNA (adenosine(37)-N6)-threonylcarbamoyltransferase complex transferase subunit TsaD [Eubacteriales bacterium]
MDHYILGIESSCDETSVSVVKNGREVLSNVINSQIKIHEQFGGVVPEIASRKHIENIDNVFKKALFDANICLDDISAICVTKGPGLVGALLVGISFAKALSYAINKPLIGIHHIEGHICANYISNKNLQPEFVCLIVSGGHTNLVIVKDYTKYELIGKTKDDACGECFDKVARALGLSYPGGPKLEQRANMSSKEILFPHGIVEDNKYDFTFSGLKSHTLNYINKQDKLNDEIINDISKAFQDSIIYSLVSRSIDLCLQKNIKKLAIAGGVAANKTIRKALEEECTKNNIQFFSPENIYCTDNAAMIASAGYYEYFNGKRDNLELNAYPNLKLGE